MVTESLEHAVLANESSQPQSSYEAAALLIEFELKKILIDKMDKSESYLTTPEHRECYDGLIKSYELDKNLLSTYDKVYSLKRSRKDNDKNEDLSAESDQGLKKRKTSKHAEPSKGPKTKESKSGSSKGTGGILTMAHTTSTTKTKATQYDLQGIEDMVPNIWSLVKVAYDKYALWVTRVRRCETWVWVSGEIENRLTNLSGNDVSDFAISLRMFTRSMVIQKRFEDL
ncbi:hypothetical protein Tco_1058583 [Tanacetum coccineum]|uniref:Uncharacterized protein n=1 Tax=Tanacetum coccineum TaxID=301880 RepID=A0ABQ5H8Q3_9ASTR